MSSPFERDSKQIPDYIEQTITDETEFDLLDGKTLIITNNPLALQGLERVLVQNTPEGIKVIAKGHGRFSVKSRREDANPHIADYIVAGPSMEVSFEDHLIAAFWGQFTWEELSVLQKNKKLVAKVSRIIRCLAEEFDEKAIEELNNLPEIKQLIRFGSSGRR